MNLAAEYARTIENRLTLPLNEGPDKRMSVKEAVAKFVKPESLIYISGAHGRPQAITHEITRQWWGKSPNFTIAALGVGSPATMLFRGGLVKKLITAYIGEGYPFPIPQRITGKLAIEDKLEVQSWSLYVFALRLLGGAMGVPFMTTKSLIGSTMEEDLTRDGELKVVDDPFGGGKKIAYAKSLNPDLALIHAWAADAAGNVICANPAGENIYGAMAAKNGAIVTVEKIVSTDFIRRNSSRVKIPAQYVRAVCEAPYGSHPGGMHPNGIEGFEGYAEDLSFFMDMREAFRDPARADAWIQEWVLSSKDHTDYLAKVGYSRIMEVKGRADTDVWKSDLELAAATMPGPDAPPNAVERMVVTASNMLLDRVKAKGYKTFLAGIGTSNLAAWLAALKLKDSGEEFELMAEVGMLGYLPRPAEPHVFSFRNIPHCKVLTDIIHAMGIFMGGAENRCMGSLAAGQIDKSGNINSTKIPGKTWITGSGGANDIATASREVMVTLQQTPTRFVDQVPYITCPGKNVWAVVSQLGIYEKNDSGELILVGVHPGRPEAEAVEAARNACGWDLKVAGRVTQFPEPSMDDVRLIRLFDPRGYFIGED